MAYHLEDTIAAIASAAGDAARGIVRLSGPRVVEVVESCFAASDEARQRDDSSASGFKSLRDLNGPTVVSGHVSVPGALGQVSCDLYFWPDRRSYTRQPAAEIHTCASAPVLSAVVRTLCAGGARLAEPGEFTLRAFLAGRLDLTQAEAVLGVIDARGSQDLAVALEQLAGGLARPLQTLRDTLLDLLARVEASLDFAEEDIELVSRAEIAAEITGAQTIVEKLAIQMAAREQAADLGRIVLEGWPNVGKSSLFNCLVAHAGALVSDQPGTTRDYLVGSIDLPTVRRTLVDTAGRDLLAGAASIDSAAQQLSRAQSQRADVNVLCLDATRPLNDWERQRLAEPRASQVIVWTKCDDPLANSLVEDFGLPPNCPSPVLRTSARTGEGLQQLRLMLEQVALAAGDGEGNFAVGTADRCRDSLRSAGESLGRAAAVNQTRSGDELLAAEIRHAVDDLGRVVGAVYTDDILDRIFSKFCIGK